MIMIRCRACGAGRPFGERAMRHPCTCGTYPLGKKDFRIQAQSESNGWPKCLT